MCGIGGAFAFGSDAQPPDRRIVMRLNDLQRHRGPDGAGIWSSEDDRLFLGHRRLAIIDTSSSGAQPMSDISGRWTISFNGEIYNYRLLRVELERLGRTFRTDSDTEVLINSIAQWGVGALNKLRGMFAFALWDAEQRELWLARDPYGIKPLYLSESQETIWFASQARPLALTAPVDRRREAAALVGFYLWGHVPEPYSWWAGVRMFPPGHVQRIRTGAAVSKPVAFARVEDAYANQAAAPLIVGELRTLLLESVRRHLVADVPVGIFLSGGIDSNVIAALAAELGSRLRTITVTFDEYVGTANDESPLAESAAKALGGEHVTVRIGRDEFEDVLEDFLSAMDQPTIDGLNTYLISRAAKMQGLKVVLSGLGGDELFGGYPSFRQIPLLLRWGRPISLCKPLGNVLAALIRATPLPGIPPKTASLLTHSGCVASAYLMRRCLHLENELEALLDESWLREGLARLSTIAAMNNTVAGLRAAGVPVHGQVAALESCWYLRNQLLRDTDWSSMAHGLEVRVPYVDATLIERLGPLIASNAPPNKRNLAACAPSLSPKIVNRAKTGFTTPLRTWTDSATGRSTRGLRGWATEVHRTFRTLAQPQTPSALPMAAA